MYIALAAGGVLGIGNDVATPTQTLNSEAQACDAMLALRTHSRWAATQRDATAVRPFGERKLTHPDRVFSNGVSNASLCARAQSPPGHTHTRTRTHELQPALKTLDEANSKARPVTGFAHMPKRTRPFFPDAEGDGRASVLPRGRVAHEAGDRSRPSFRSGRASLFSGSQALIGRRGTITSEPITGRASTAMARTLGRPSRISLALVTPPRPRASCQSSLARLTISPGVQRVTGRLGRSAAREKQGAGHAHAHAHARRVAPTPVHVIYPSMMGFDRPPPTARRRAVPSRLMRIRRAPARARAPPFHSIPSPLPSKSGDIIPRVEWTGTDARARSPPSSHQAGIGPVDPQPQGVQTQYHCSAEPHRSASPRTLARSRHAPPASVRPSARPPERPSGGSPSAAHHADPAHADPPTPSPSLLRLRSFAKSSECPRFLPILLETATGTCPCLDPSSRAPPARSRKSSRACLPPPPPRRPHPPSSICANDWDVLHTMYFLP
ncbi:hypothetical protein HETIRDRAFT_448274 [Heterobasidion irregulare TC 32-1]|uniref:Uncharacterized protein n=1 Tax=Heterobasidion irregulare (strain TC 32-1) TaxID=747525 RepID=W4KIW4_HETIT|nr:uncharacterized protein HETIRDRAFT_448274 [Heterobasidion irregulare TC 32-1]ETW85011.1 hypothetical protein HETIRDRAFT_448274 [Heterobasidion irregulare TC 32-1]